jgi:hypothetical protein
VHTLAASMHSSISLCASLRGAGTMRSMRPLSSNTSASSTVSKSIAPRFSRALASTLYSAYRLSSRGSSARAACDVAVAGSDSHCQTSV